MTTVCWRVGVCRRWHVEMCSGQMDISTNTEKMGNCLLTDHSMWHWQWIISSNSLHNSEHARNKAQTTVNAKRIVKKTFVCNLRAQWSNVITSCEAHNINKHSNVTLAYKWTEQHFHYRPGTGVSLYLCHQFQISQCRTAVLHCCKGDAASQWEMAILGASELCNPWTDWLKIWHTWLRRWVDLVCRVS